MALQRGTVKKSSATSPLPGHHRVEEWNGLSKCDPITITPTLRKNSFYLFLAYVTPPNGGDPYVEVLEQQSPNKTRLDRRTGKRVPDRGPRLVRTVPPGSVKPMPKQIRKRLEAKKKEKE